MKKPPSEANSGRVTNPGKEGEENDSAAPAARWIAKPHLMDGAQRSQNRELMDKNRIEDLPRLGAQASSGPGGARHHRVIGGRSARFPCRPASRAGAQGLDHQSGHKSGKIQLLCHQSGTNRPHVVALSVETFLQRWLTHVLPKGFVRVRISKSSIVCKALTARWMKDQGVPGMRLPLPR